MNKKRLTIPIIIFLSASIIMIVAAIFFRINQLQNTPRSTPEESFDKASGEMITTFTGFSSNDYGGIMFVNINWLLERGMLSKTVDDIKQMMYDHSKKNNNYIKRVSVYKDGYKRASQKVNTIKIAINNDEKDMYIKEVLKGYENYELYLYSDEEMKNEIANYKFCSVLSCPPEIPKDLKVIDSNYDG